MEDHPYASNAAWEVKNFWSTQQDPMPTNNSQTFSAGTAGSALDDLIRNAPAGSVLTMVVVNGATTGNGSDAWHNNDIGKLSTNGTVSTDPSPTDATLATFMTTASLPRFTVNDAYGKRGWVIDLPVEKIVEAMDYSTNNSFMINMWDPARPILGIWLYYKVEPFHPYKGDSAWTLKYTWGDESASIHENSTSKTFPASDEIIILTWWASMTSAVNDLCNNAPAGSIASVALTGQAKTFSIWSDWDGLVNKTSHTTTPPYLNVDGADVGFVDIPIATFNSIWSDTEFNCAAFLKPDGGADILGVWLYYPVE
jgi:hypothetical protein